jgi:hypothetical protein
MKHVRSLLAMQEDLQAPPRTLRPALRQAGIHVPENDLVAVDSRSTEFNRLIQIVLGSKLASSKVMITFHRNPKPGDKRPADFNSQSPFYQLSEAVLEGFEYEAHPDDNGKPDLIGSYYLLGPAREVIPRVLSVLRAPPADSCPIAHAYPSGTCIINVHFHFKNWAFAGRVYRD